jgi:hypothetical protein
LGVNRRDRFERAFFSATTSRLLKAITYVGVATVLLLILTNH